MKRTWINEAVELSNGGILSAIGRTPLIKLARALPNLHFSLYAKLEGLNPGGSIKDRPAIEIIRRGIETGIIGPDTVIIESSSGNMAIGLAQACAYLGLQLICVVDPKITSLNLSILKAFGVQIEVVLQTNADGEYLEARLDRVQQLLQSIDNSYWPNQYDNSWNAEAHSLFTMPEIVAQLRGDIDYFFCLTSTCGTITGCAEYIRSNGMSTKVIAVDAIGSVIFGGKKAKRLIPGHGAAVKPGLCRNEIIDDCIHVSDEDCILGCRRLLRSEAILEEVTVADHHAFRLRSRA